jgi:hypothetical protein
MLSIFHILGNNPYSANFFFVFVDDLGELDLPFLTMLFVITAPYQAISLRFVVLSRYLF